MTAQHDDLQDRITAALELRPDVQVPADFTARMMARLPAHTLRSPARLPVTMPRLGRTFAVAVLLLFLVAMAVLPAFAEASLAFGITQAVVLLQVFGMVLWLGLARRNQA